MDIHLYRVVHDQKHILIFKFIHTELYMTKTYNNTNLTHNRFNPLITHHIHKQTNKLNQLIK